MGLPCNRLVSCQFQIAVYFAQCRASVVRMFPSFQSRTACIETSLVVVQNQAHSTALKP